MKRILLTNLLIGNCRRSLETTETDLMLTAQDVATNPKFMDDLWNLKIIFSFHDKIREMEFPTMFTTNQVEELKTLLWRWKFQEMSK